MRKLNEEMIICKCGIYFIGRVESFATPWFQCQPVQMNAGKSDLISTLPFTYLIPTFSQIIAQQLYITPH